MSDLRKIEKVQKRALRIIFNDKNATYTELRKQSERPLIYVERIKHIVQTIFKIYHGISPNYLNGFISKANISYDIRNRNILTLLILSLLSMVMILLNFMVYCYGITCLMKLDRNVILIYSNVF